MTTRVPFTKVVVDNREEGKFRQRALNRAPKEHIEALWGYVRNDIAYICAFVKCEVKHASSVMLRTPDDEWDLHEADAADVEIVDSVTGQRIKLEFLGTIHTHPDCDDAVLSEHDVRESLDTQELIVAVCAIQMPKGKNRKTIITYWPALRPLTVERKKNYESFAAKAGTKRRAKKSRR